MSNSISPWETIELGGVADAESPLDTADWFRSDLEHTPVILRNEEVDLPLGVCTRSRVRYIEGLAAMTRSVAGPIGNGKAVLSRTDLPMFADLLDLRRFPADRADMILPECRLRIVRPDSRAYALKFSDSWESFFLSRSKNFRQNLRTAENRTQREFGSNAIKFKEYQLSAENWNEMFSLGKQLAQKSWQGLDGVSVFLRQDKLDWLKRLHTFGFILTLFFLKVNDEIWGVALEIKRNMFSGVLLYLIEFDQARSFFSPGQLLLQNILKQNFAQGIRTIDFGVGEGAHKDAWCNRKIDLVRILVPLTAVGHFAVRWQQLRWAVGRLRTTVICRK